MPNFETLEAAQAEIVRLNDVVTEITNERDTLSQNNETLTQELAQVRSLNQQYFNRLSAQFQREEEDPEEPEPMTCAEFAKKFKII